LARFAREKQAPRGARNDRKKGNDKGNIGAPRAYVVGSAKRRR
jgi:hypothetical protein